MGRIAIDISGKRFERFTVLYRTGDEGNKWLCRCDCGNEFTEHSKYIRRGDRKSCGKCLREYWLGGDSKSPEYKAWQNMKAKEGVEICKEWMDSFTKFLMDMGRKPAEAQQLKRKDESLPYGKGNCFWG